MEEDGSGDGKRPPPPTHNEGSALKKGRKDEDSRDLGKSHSLNEPPNHALLRILTPVVDSLPLPHGLNGTVSVTTERISFQYAAFESPLEAKRMASEGICPFCRTIHEACDTQVHLLLKEGRCEVHCESDSNVLPWECPESIMEKLQSFCHENRAWIEPAKPPKNSLEVKIAQLLPPPPHHEGVWSVVRVGRLPTVGATWRMAVTCAEPLCRYPIDAFALERYCRVCWTPLDLQADYLAQCIHAVLKGRQKDARACVMRQCGQCEVLCRSDEMPTGATMESCWHCKGNLDRTALQQAASTLQYCNGLQPWERALAYREQDLEFLDRFTRVVCGTCCTLCISLTEFVRRRGRAHCSKGHDLRQLLLRAPGDSPSSLSLSTNAFRAQVPRNPCWICGKGECKVCKPRQGASCLGICCRACGHVVVSGEVCEASLLRCRGCKAALMDQDELNQYRTCFGIEGFVPTLNRLVELAVHRDSLSAFESREGELLIDPEDEDGLEEDEVEGEGRLRVRGTCFYWKSETGPQFVRCSNFVLRGLGKTNESTIVELNGDGIPRQIPHSALDSMEALLAHLDQGFWCNIEGGARDTICAITRRECRRTRFISSNRLGTTTNSLQQRVFCLSNAVQWDRATGEPVTWKDSHILVMHPVRRDYSAALKVREPLSPLREVHQWVTRVWGGFNEMQVIAGFGYAVMCLFRSDFRQGQPTEFPCCWAHGKGGSGKSTLGELLVALCGAGEVVKTISETSLYKKADTLRDCVLVVDDKEVDASEKNTRRKGTVKKEAVYKLAHDMSDSTPRETEQGSYAVHCGVMFCTNFDPPQPGTPQHRRLLILPFEEPQGRPAAEDVDTTALDEIKERLPAAIGALLGGISIDLDEVTRLQRAYINEEPSIHAKSKARYARWLYFILRYGKLVLDMGEEEVWERFQHSILGSSALYRACRACQTLNVPPAVQTLEHLARLDGVEIVTSSALGGDPPNPDVQVLVVRVEEQQPFAQTLFEGSFSLCSLVLQKKSYQVFKLPTEKIDFVEVYALFYARRLSVPTAVATKSAPKRREVTEYTGTPVHATGTADGKPIVVWMVEVDGLRYWVKSSLEDQLKKVGQAKLAGRLDHNSSYFDSVDFPAKSDAAHALWNHKDSTGKSLGKTGAKAVLISVDDKILKEHKVFPPQ